MLLSLEKRLEAEMENIPAITLPKPYLGEA